MSELNNDVLLELIAEYKEQRDSLKKMIIDLNLIKDKIDKLFPENLDKRYIRFFEEKMKSVTSLFSTILDIRKEIMKSVKTEFELRNVMHKLYEKDDDSLDDFDIDGLEDIITKIQEDHKKQKEKRLHLRTKGVKHVKLESVK